MLEKAGLGATESHFNEWNYVGPEWDDMEGMRLPALEPALPAWHLGRERGGPSRLRRDRGAERKVFAGQDAGH